MIAAILMLPIVITFIVQLATGMGLGVFSVVTASMMLVAALTVVPLMSTNNRLLKCILAGVASLMLILFFVDLDEWRRKLPFLGYTYSIWYINSAVSDSDMSCVTSTGT